MVRKDSDPGAERQPVNRPAIQHSSEDFERLIEGVRDCAIYMLDPRPRRFLESWRGAHQGLQRRGDRRPTLLRVLHARGSRHGLPERALRTAETAGKFEGEGWRVRKDGTKFWASVLIDPVRDNDGSSSASPRSRAT